MQWEHSFAQGNAASLESVPSNARRRLQAGMADFTLLQKIPSTAIPRSAPGGGAEGPSAPDVLTGEAGGVEGAGGPFAPYDLSGERILPLLPPQRRPAAQRVVD